MVFRGGKRLKKLGFLVFAILVLVLIALWIAAGTLASPARREIQPYHRSYLESPEAHGIKISRVWLDETPFLFVVPDLAMPLGERGKVLVRQLAEEDFGLSREVRGLVVLLHGRNGRKEDLLPVAERFASAGLVSIIPDLPAHGENLVTTVGFGSRMSETIISGKLADFALAELGNQNIPQYLWGMSMGGSFAVHAAAHEPERWEKLVVVASFDSLDGVVGDSLRDWSGPLAPVLLKALTSMVELRGGVELRSVRPVAKAKTLRIPTLVIHGDEDELIREGRGRELYNSFAGPKRWLTVSGGNHDNVLVTEAPVYAEMVKWLLMTDHSGFE